MEEWRKHYIKLLNFKSVERVEFDSQMRDIIYADDKVDDMTIPLETVIKELKYYKDLIYESGVDLAEYLNNRDKLNFCNVAENFIEKWEDDSMEGYIPLNIRTITKEGEVIDSERHNCEFYFNEELDESERIEEDIFKIKDGEYWIIRNKDVLEDFIYRLEENYIHYYEIEKEHQYRDKDAQKKITSMINAGKRVLKKVEETLEGMS